MGILDDGFLGLEIDGTSRIITWINDIITSLALVTQLTIGLITFLGMSKSPEVNSKLKLLFLGSVLSAITYTISEITGNIMIMVTGSEPLILVITFAIAFFLFFVCLLANLVCRLYITFKGSIYGMSKIMYISFVLILFSLFLIPSFVFPVLFLHLEWNEPVLPQWFLQYAYYATFSFLGLFMTGSALAVYYFTRNLDQLATARNISLQKLAVDEEGIALDRMQQRMIDVAARYVLLFVIATLSTMLATVLSFMINVGSGLRDIGFSIDSCINLLCLSLQFAFAQEQYQKCCGCCDVWCRDLISRRTRRALHMHSIHVMKSRIPSESSDATDTYTLMSI